MARLVCWCPFPRSLLTLLAALLVAGAVVPSAPARGQPMELALACPSPVPVMVFNDVSASDVHGGAIECLLAWEITRGVTAAEYGPARPVSREQMATFLTRLVRVSGQSLAAPLASRFDDVDGTHADNIGALAAAGIAQGTGETTFSPSRSVTRAQMATFIVRTLDYLGLEIAGAAPPFEDVASSSVHAEAIGALAGEGVVQGRTASTYDPTGVVTRAQMASFLMRAADVLVAEDLTSPPYVGSPGRDLGDPDDEVTEVVGAEGGRVELGGAVVEFPRDAVPDGTTVTLADHGIGDISTEVTTGAPAALGARFRVTASEPLRVPVVVTLPADLSPLSADHLDAVFIRHVSADGDRYLTGDVDAAAGQVSVAVEEFSWFQPIFDVPQRWLLDASEWLTEATGVRTDAPSCNQPDADHYDVSDPGAAFDDPWLRTCVEVVGDQLELRVRNNRTYAMRVEPDGQALTHHGAHDTGDLVAHAIGEYFDPPVVMPQAEQRFRLPADQLGNLHYAVDWPATVTIRAWASLKLLEDELGAAKWGEVIADGIDCVRQDVGTEEDDAAALIGAGYGCIDAVAGAIPRDANWAGIPLGRIATVYGQLMFTASSTGALYDLAIDATSGGSGPLLGTVTANIEFTPPELSGSDGVYVTRPDRWDRPQLPVPSAAWTYVNEGPSGGGGNQLSVALDGGHAVVGPLSVLSSAKYFEMDVLAPDGGVGFRVPYPLPDDAWNPFRVAAVPGGDLVALGHSPDGPSIVRLTPGGQVRWQRHLEWTHYPGPGGMVLDGEGNLYVGNAGGHHQILDVDTGAWVGGPVLRRSTVRFLSDSLLAATEGLVTAVPGGVMKISAHRFVDDASAQIDYPQGRSGGGYSAVDEDGTTYAVAKTDIGGCRLVLDRIDVDWDGLNLDVEVDVWSASMERDDCGAARVAPDWVLPDPAGGVVVGWALPYADTLNITRIAPDGTERSNATIERHQRSFARMATDGTLYVLFEVLRAPSPDDECGTSTCRDPRIITVDPDGGLQTVLSDTVAPYTWIGNGLVLGQDKIYVSGRYSHPNQQVVAMLEQPGVQPLDPRRHNRLTVVR